MSSFEAFRADVAFNVETGRAEADIRRLREEAHAAFSGMSDDALRLAVARDKYDRALVRAAGNVQKAAAAEVRYRREVEQVTRASEREAAALNRTQHEFGQVTRGALTGSGALRGFARSAAFMSTTFLGSAGVVYGIRQAVNAASNLNEQTSKTQQVFRSSSSEVLAWSKTTASGIGLASDEALQAVSTFGALLRPLGYMPAAAKKASVGLVELGADLDSFYNSARSGEGAEALRSGILGEVEPLRRFGVALTEARVQQVALAETGKKSATELTTQEKVAARLAIIYRDTAIAQGDFARTSGGLANQQRILHANVRQLEIALGSELTPALTEVVGGMNDWLGDTKNQQRLQRDLHEIVKEGTGVVTGFAHGLDLIHDATGPVVDALGGLENVVEAALVAGFVAKAARASRALAGIGAAERALTGVVVAESAKQAAAVGGVGAAGGAKGAVPVGGGKGGGTFVAALAAWLGYETVFPQGISGVGQPIASDTRGDNGSPYPKGSPADAAFQKTIARLVGGYAGIEGARSSAANYVTPQQLLSGTGSIGVPPLTAAQERALGLSRTEGTGTPAEVAAQRARAEYDRRALEFLEQRHQAGKITNAKYVEQYQAIYGDLTQRTQRIAAIAQANAQAAKGARDKAAKARADLIANTIPDSLSGRGVAPGAFGRYQAAGAALIGGTLGAYASTVPADLRARLVAGATGVPEELTLRTQIAEARFASHPEKVKPYLRAELNAELANLRLLKRIGASEVEILRERLQIEQTRQRIRGIGATSATGGGARANEAQFLASFQQIVGAYAPNAFLRGGGKSETHLYEAVHELRQQTNVLQRLAGHEAFPTTRHAYSSALAAFG